MNIDKLKAAALRTLADAEGDDALHALCEAADTIEELERKLAESNEREARDYNELLDKLNEVKTQNVKLTISLVEAERRQVAEWISVEDRLPDLDVPVWLYEPGRSIWIGERTDHGDRWLWGNSYGTTYSRADGTWSSSSNECDDDYQPTHWLPLPTNPIAAAPEQPE